MTEKRILLIEDEATTRAILTEVLRGEGYAVDSVATAAAATTCLGSISYALVVADWVLPDGDGTDIADMALQLGSKTLIVTGQLTALPAGRLIAMNYNRSSWAIRKSSQPSGGLSVILNRRPDEAAPRRPPMRANYRRIGAW